MNTVYRFDEKEPPVVTERMLREELKRRQLKRQIIWLYLASVIVSLCGVLFAFLIAPAYFVAAVCCIVGACAYLMFSGMISVLFYVRRNRDYERSV